MADEPENLTMRLLQEIRSEMREGFEKAFGDLAALRKALSELCVGFCRNRRASWVF